MPGLANPVVALPPTPRDANPNVSLPPTPRDANPVVTLPPTPRDVVPRADTTQPAELCGFVDHTASHTCSSGWTCKFNTDYYAVGCCSGEVCDWVTTCCDYSPSSSSVVSWGSFTAQCGGSNTELVGTCSSAHRPFCATLRYENGYNRLYCTDASHMLTQTGYFTSSGESVARAGIPRLTGSKGATTAPPPSEATVTETSICPGPPNVAGPVVGSLIGGAVFGAAAALLSTWFILRRHRAKKAAAAATPPAVQQPEATPVQEAWQSPPISWCSPSSPTPYDVPKGRGELPAQ